LTSLRREKDGVLHVIEQYPHTTITFIYSYLASHRAFRPVVLTQAINRASRTEGPPLDAVYELSGQWRRGSRLWWLGRMDERLLGRPPFTTATLRVIRRHGVRVIHAHFGPQGVWALPLRGAAGLPLVTTFYGYDVAALGVQPEWRAAYERLFAQGDLFLVEGPYMYARLSALGCPETKIATQPIAIDLERIRFRARFLEPGESPRLLMCGRLVEKKGVADAVAAVAEVVRAVPGTTLTIIGEGPLRAALLRQVAELGVESAVRFVGEVGYDGFLEALDRAHVFLVPSVTASNGDTEGGTPTVLFEAQAAGLPVIATRHAGIPYGVAEGESAWLVPERRPDLLAAEVVRLLRRPEVWASAGVAGRRHVADGHDAAVEIDRLEDHYRRVQSQAFAGRRSDG
jgi:colanic acid/amylovoran biosynthesis glycosyltransferase